MPQQLKPLGELSSPGGESRFDVWRAPLVPVAVALTAGIAVDRFAIVPLPLSLAAALGGVLAWVIHGLGPRKHLGLAFLLVGVAGVGCGWHHTFRYGSRATGVDRLADAEGRPVRLKGIVDTTPRFSPAESEAPLRSFPRQELTRFVLRITHAQDLAARTWTVATGPVQTSVTGAVRGLRVGEEIEAAGRLSVPEGPMNPGEPDFAGSLRDQGVVAIFSVQSAEQVDRLGTQSSLSFGATLAAVRAWAEGVLRDSLARPEADVASALLLGEGSALGGEGWEKYQRTGVLHVLAISGQHLVVLGGFLALALRAGGMRKRKRVLAVSAAVLLYALLTGGRPPVMRAAWMTLAFSGAVLLRRPSHPAATFALAWVVVALTNPADVFSPGCQLSFLAVAVLSFGLGPSLPAPSDPLDRRLASVPDDALERLRDESRSVTARVLRRIVGWVIWFYAVNAAVWLALAPLIAWHYHTVSPAALLLGPPLVLLTSAALLTGFAVLFLAPLCWPLAQGAAALTGWSLMASEWLVDLAGGGRGAYFYVPDVPTWWLAAFYLGVGLALTLPALARHWRPAAGLGGAWSIVGVAVVLWPTRPGEFRCTFLAVGHGGCTVIETPGGRVLVYDAGSLRGPEVTRRHIAPFLWHRGVRRVDELLVSHADLDHFNGVPELLERFTVGRLTHTPTFPSRDSPAVRAALAAVERRGVPTRVVRAGDAWEEAGLTFEVLHPPADGPPGTENARSLVLLVRDGPRSLLLTGDLEDAGLDRVLATPTRGIDVLMSPHHGSKRANTPALAAWADPQVVVSCQGPPRAPGDRGPFGRWSVLLPTWPHGAVTVTRGDDGWRVETYLTKRVVDVSARGPPGGRP